MSYRWAGSSRRNAATGTIASRGTTTVTMSRNSVTRNFVSGNFALSGWSAGCSIVRAMPSLGQVGPGGVGRRRPGRAGGIVVAGADAVNTRVRLRPVRACCFASLLCRPADPDVVVVRVDPLVVAGHGNDLPRLAGHEAQPVAGGQGHGLERRGVAVL